jgi:ATP-dependent helicase/nuclease subunit A
MQSCYGFRDANVGLFLDIRERGLPAVSVEALDLEVNFRSRRGRCHRWRERLRGKRG